MIFSFDYIVEPQLVDTSLTIRLTAIESMLLNSAGKAADQLHIGVDDMLKENGAWVLSRLAWQLDYRPRIGSVITVETWIDHVERMFSFRNFRLIQDGKTIGLGKSIWSVLNISTRMPVNLQDERFTSLSTNIDNGMEMPRKVAAVKSDSLITYQPKYSDIDFNGHCNSVQYLQWMLDSLPYTEATALPSKRVDINYLHEVLPQEMVLIACEQTDKYIICEVRNQEGKVAARAAIEK